jgi:hypothetical protein
MVHYTLRTDLPAFFGKQMTADIYAPDILFEESVSSIGLSCHGHSSYRYGLYGSGVCPWDFGLDMQHWCRRLLGGLRRLGRALLRSPRVDVHSCVAHDAHGEVHVRWSVRGTWRLLGRPYALEAMSVYVVNDRGQVAYHRYACRVAMVMVMAMVMVRECRLTQVAWARCDRVQRDMTRNRARGLLSKLFPDAPELSPMPSCTHAPPPL